MNNAKLVRAINKIGDDLYSETERIVALVVKLKAEKEQIRAELECEREDKLRWRKAFNSVTPGGSEYMDPELCVAWCRRIQSEMHEAKKRVVLLEREAASSRLPRTGNELLASVFTGEVPSTARRK